MPENLPLKGKVAIVTGSSKGIGRAIALRLVRDGCSVVVNGRNTADINSVINEIKKAKGKAFGIQADVSSAKDAERLVTETVKAYGRLDIFVNNAGILEEKMLIHMTEQDWDKTLCTNLKGYFLCGRAAVAQMMRQKTGVTNGNKTNGNIINITSIAGMGAFSGYASYSASKAGIISLTQTMAVEFAAANIRVNAVAPGMIETAMTADVMKNKPMFEQLVKNIPCNRVGKPADIANAVAFLVSDEADYITGTTLVVDGGWTAKL